MDSGQTLARFVAGLRFEDLAAEVVGTLKRMVLDTFGTALAGTTLGSGCPQLIALLASAGGNAQSTVWGTRLRLPAAAAALANGATAHALNYDDVFSGGGHLSAVTLPAALSVAELETHVSGAELLAALAAGAEVMARLQQTIGRADDPTSEARPQPTQLSGAFAAASSAARVLGLDADQTWSALGLALMQASGSRQPVLQGTPAKALYAGFPNQAGVLSAQLARAGVDGRCDVFDGPAGLFQTAYRGSYDRSALVDGLGDRFRMTHLGFKPWPTTKHAHAFIQAAQRIGARHRVQVDQIERVVVSGGPHIRAFCEPLEMRRQPTGWVQAEDSIPFTVSKALLNGDVVLADFMPAGLSQPQARALAARVEYRIQADLRDAAIVEVQFVDGQALVERVDHPLGQPEQPLDEGALRRKFFDCARHAVNPARREDLDRLLDTIDHLEDVEDVVCLTALVSPVHV